MNRLFNQRRPAFVLTRGILTAFFILILALVIRQVVLRAGLSDPTASFYDHPAYRSEVVLEKFPIYRQAYANSCGPTTISMVYSYLVEPITEQELARKLDIPLGRGGMLPAQFQTQLQSALGTAGYRVEHQTNVPDAALLERIYLQLKQGFPVPVYFSTLNAWDKPSYDTHYSVVIGIRPQERVLVIANAYGFLEEMPIADFLQAVKYENYRNPPLDFQLGLLSRVIERSNLYLIQK